MEHLSSSICKSCRTRLAGHHATRTFSTSTRHQIVPPESPAYVDVPSSFQETYSQPRREKGILPVPREIFPKNRPVKPSQQYLDNLTKSPLPKNEVPYESLSELGKYRYRMAQLRKKHIREGLTELHKRKVNTIGKMENRSQARQHERARLLKQAPREDARLTNNSVPQAMLPNRSKTPLADALAAAKANHEQKVANYNATVAAKNDERLDALHTLYMNAREFITTEQQLNDAIENVFDTEKAFRTTKESGKSMWAKGAPDTIRDMITQSKVHDSAGGKLLNNIGSRVTTGSSMRFQRDQERMKKIAEKLSGGKI